MTLSGHYTFLPITFDGKELETWGKSNVEHFDFDLTCDVTGDLEVIKICFPSTVFPGLSNAA